MGGTAKCSQLILNKLWIQQFSHHVFCLEDMAKAISKEVAKIFLFYKISPKVLFSILQMGNKNTYLLCKEAGKKYDDCFGTPLLPISWAPQKRPKVSQYFYCQERKNSQNQPLKGQNKCWIATICKKIKNKTQTFHPTSMCSWNQETYHICLCPRAGNWRYRICWLLSALPCNLNIL